MLLAQVKAQCLNESNHFGFPDRTAPGGVRPAFNIYGEFYCAPFCGFPVVLAAVLLMPLGSHSRDTAPTSGSGVVLDLYKREPGHSGSSCYEH